jgi:BirA family biotin operon repressor/biotin-[acetyl-CoA-carboxylase] ligase
MLEGRKVAGILCQAVAQGPRWAAIVGIGINVNTSIQDLPEMLRDEAATLAGATGRAWDIDAIAHAVAASVEHWLNLTREFGIAGLVQCLAPFDALRGRRLRLESDNRVVDGVGAGLAADGSLLIRCEDGTTESFERGSICH